MLANIPIKETQTQNIWLVLTAGPAGPATANRTSWVRDLLGLHTKLTNVHLWLCLVLGPCPGLQTQTDHDGHAGDLLPSSLTVFVEDVDLLWFKEQAGLDLHHTTRPKGVKAEVSRSSSPPSLTRGGLTRR